MYTLMKHSVAVDDPELASWETQLRKGGLGLAVLGALTNGPLYGLEIIRTLEARAGLSVPEGTIYPLLNRLKDGGYITARWVEADTGHPRKYYELTKAGMARLAAMKAIWSAFASGIDRLIAPARGGRK